MIGWVIRYRKKKIYLSIYLLFFVLFDYVYHLHTYKYMLKFDHAR